jgi:HSP20 family protein
MAIIRWQPGWDMSKLRALRDMEGWPTRSLLDQWPLAEKEWNPPIEMIDKKDKYVLKAEVPGICADDIDVSIVGNNLIVRGEKRAETETKEEDYYYKERSYGSFYRSIPLPSEVDEQKIEANYEDGVLEIEIPKAVKATPKKISVKAAKKIKSNKSKPTLVDSTVV